MSSRRKKKSSIGGDQDVGKKFLVFFLFSFFLFFSFIIFFFFWGKRRGVGDDLVKLLLLFKGAMIGLVSRSRKGGKNEKIKNQIPKNQQGSKNDFKQNKYIYIYIYKILL